MVHARAGVNNAIAQFPHACGDGPRENLNKRFQPLISPRVWGWSGCRDNRSQGRSIFPTRGRGLKHRRDACATTNPRSPLAWGAWVETQARRLCYHKPTVAPRVGGRDIIVTGRTKFLSRPFRAHFFLFRFLGCCPGLVCIALSALRKSCCYSSSSTSGAGKMPDLRGKVF